MKNLVVRLTRPLYIGHARPRRVLLAVSAAAVVGAFIAPAGAQAYQTLNSQCILKITAPYNDGIGDLVSSGETYCGQYTWWTTFQECMDVQNGSNWYTVGDSCTPGSFSKNNAVYSENFYAASDNGLYPGHVYKTYDQGAAYLGNGSTGPGTGDGYASQYSSTYTCCS